MRKITGFLLSLVLVGGAIFAFLNYQLIVDNVVASQYEQSAGVAKLVEEVQFSERGDFLFRATQAKLDDPNSFNRHCQKKDKQSIVLGCYLGPQQIYIYDVNDNRLNGVKQVTAAHEMLHAAYDRLTISDRKKINRQIEAALPSVLQSSTDLAERLKIYEKTEPGERYNELHSILGSEAEQLPYELENYYKQYFKDRRIITAFATAYGKVFNDLKKNQDALVAELGALNAEISALSQDYNSRLESLNGDIDSFNARASMRGGFDSEPEFNAVRNNLLAMRDQLETQRDLINQKISYYQEKQKELEALNVQVEDLNSKLDSTKLPAL